MMGAQEDSEMKRCTECAGANPDPQPRHGVDHGGDVSVIELLQRHVCASPKHRVRWSEASKVAVSRPRYLSRAARSSRRALHPRLRARAT